MGLKSTSFWNSHILGDNDHPAMSVIVSLPLKDSTLDGSDAGDMFYLYFKKK